jgi:hypothetical protein
MDLTRSRAYLLSGQPTSYEQYAPEVIRPLVCAIRLKPIDEGRHCAFNKSDLLDSLRQKHHASLLGLNWQRPRLYAAIQISKGHTKYASSTRLYSSFDARSTYDCPPLVGTFFVAGEWFGTDFAMSYSTADISRSTAPEP